MKAEEVRNHEPRPGQRSAPRSRNRSLSPPQILRFAEDAVAAAEAEVSRLRKYRVNAEKAGDANLVSHIEQDLDRATKLAHSLAEEVACIKAALQPQ